jgi:hypothetical protein
MRKRLSAVDVGPPACILVLFAAVVLNSARAEKNQTFHGVVLQTIGKYEFYPGATDCSLNARPYILVPNASSERALTHPVPIDRHDLLVQAAWRVTLKGNLSSFGVYGIRMGLKSGYWRQLDVTRVDEANFLDCFESEVGSDAGKTGSR